MNEADLQYHLNFRPKDYQSEARNAQMIRTLPHEEQGRKLKPSRVLAEVTKLAVTTLIIAHVLSWVFVQLGY